MLDGANSREAGVQDGRRLFRLADNIPIVSNHLFGRMWPLNAQVPDVESGGGRRRNAVLDAEGGGGCTVGH